MGQYTKAIDLYKAQRARFANLGRSMAQLHAIISHDGLADGLELTSGGLGKGQTRGAFARGASPASSTPMGMRRGMSAGLKSSRGLSKSGAPLLPINIQSGKLRGSMRLTKESSFPRQTFRLGQQNPGGGIYTLLPGGTGKMVARGFHARVKQLWKIRNKALLDHVKALWRH